MKHLNNHVVFLDTQVCPRWWRKYSLARLSTARLGFCMLHLFHSFVSLWRQINISSHLRFILTRADSNLSELSHDEHGLAQSGILRLCAWEPRGRRLLTRIKSWWELIHSSLYPTMTSVSVRQQVREPTPVCNILFLNGWRLPLPLSCSPWRRARPIRSRA